MFQSFRFSAKIQAKLLLYPLKKFQFKKSDLICVDCVHFRTKKNEIWEKRVEKTIEVN